MKLKFRNGVILRLDAETPEDVVQLTKLHRAGTASVGMSAHNALGTISLSLFFNAPLEPSQDDDPEAAIQQRLPIRLRWSDWELSEDGVWSTTCSHDRLDATITSVIVSEENGYNNRYWEVRKGGRLMASGYCLTSGHAYAQAQLAMFAQGVPYDVVYPEDPPSGVSE